MPISQESQDKWRYSHRLHYCNEDRNNNYSCDSSIIGSYITTFRSFIAFRTFGPGDFLPLRMQSKYCPVIPSFTASLLTAPISRAMPRSITRNCLPSIRNCCPFPLDSTIDAPFLVTVSRHCHNL